MILLGPLRIQGQLELLVPVEVVTGTAQLIVAIAGTRTMTGNISRVSSKLVRNQALTHILGIG